MIIPFQKMSEECFLEAWREVHEEELGLRYPMSGAILMEVLEEQEGFFRVEQDGENVFFLSIEFLVGEESLGKEIAEKMLFCVVGGDGEVLIGLAKERAAVEIERLIGERGKVYMEEFLNTERFRKMIGDFLEGWREVGEECPLEEKLEEMGILEKKER